MRLDEPGEIKKEQPQEPNHGLTRRDFVQKVAKVGGLALVHFTILGGFAATRADAMYDNCSCRYDEGVEDACDEDEEEGKDQKDYCLCPPESDDYDYCRCGHDTNAENPSDACVCGAERPTTDYCLCGTDENVIDACECGTETSSIDACLCGRDENVADECACGTEDLPIDYCEELPGATRHHDADPGDVCECPPEGRPADWCKCHYDQMSGDDPADLCTEANAGNTDGVTDNCACCSTAGDAGTADQCNCGEDQSGSYCYQNDEEICEEEGGPGPGHPGVADWCKDDTNGTSIDCCNCPSQDQNSATPPDDKSNQADFCKSSSGSQAESAPADDVCKCGQTDTDYDPDSGEAADFCSCTDANNAQDYCDPEFSDSDYA
jgi:hypothetical protein